MRFVPRVVELEKRLPLDGDWGGTSMDWETGEVSHDPPGTDFPPPPPVDPAPVDPVPTDPPPTG